MSQRDQLDAFLDAATGDLDVDRELRMDARAELAAHLTDAAEAHTAAGCSQEEALSRAIAGMGSPHEIAAQLLAANRRRMDSRSYVRTSLSAVALPAAVLLAALVGWNALSRYVHIIHTYANIAQRPPPLPDNPMSLVDRSLVVPYSDPTARLSPEEAFYFTGDTRRQTISACQRAIWEAVPGSRTYFGNYISALFLDQAATHLSLLKQEKELGERIDPGNSRYNYLYAFALASAATEYRRTPGGDSRLFVCDRRMLDLAVDELMAGHRKPAFRRYALEMLHERLALLPPIRRIEEQAERLMISRQARTPDDTAMVFLTRIASLYARLLADEGNPGRAREVLGSWRLLALKLNEDAFCELDIDAVREIARTAASEVAPQLEAMGSVPLAKAEREMAGAIEDEIAKARKDPAASAASESVAKAGSVLALTADVPFSRPPSSDLLADGRRAEHAVLTQTAVAATMAVLLLLLAASALCGVVGRARAGTLAPCPVSVLPSLRQVTLVLGTGLIAPLSLYFAYTRWPFLSGRDLSVGYVPARFALEMVLLVVTVAAAVTFLTSLTTRKRCSELGIPIPPSRFRPEAMHALLLAALWLVALCVRSRQTQASLGIPALAVGGAMLAAWLAWRLLAAARGALSRGPYAAFHRTVLYSAVPFYALSVVLLAVVVHPLWGQEEISLLRRESAYSRSTGGALINVEFADALRARNRLRKLAPQENHE